MDANIKFVLYANDTNVFIASDTIEKCIEKANYVLASIQKYMPSNILHINLDKCCYMWFKYKNVKSCLCTTNKCPFDNSKNKSSHKNSQQYCNNEPSIYIGSTKITFETEVRYLGVILGSKLLWNAHIKLLVKKLKTSIATIKRITANIPKGCLKSVYHTLFESHLIYGISVWGNTSQANIDKLFRLQKRCIRIIFDDREKFLDEFCTAARTQVFGSQSLGASFYSKEHTKPLFTDNSILTVHNLYTYLSCTEFMKIVKFQTPSSIASKITLSIRNKGILVSLPVKNRHFLYNASIIWNLSINKIGVPSVHEISPCVFKAKLKRFLLANQFSGNKENWTDNNIKYRLFTCDKHKTKPSN